MKILTFNQILCHIITDTPKTRKRTITISKTEGGDSNSSPNTIETSSIFQLLDIVGVGMELKASEWFTWWGTFVAKHKIIVMLSSMIIATVFALGMVKMIITTDPVELWAGPNSRSRIEKDFFDSNFRPFYRTEMVIIKAKNLDTVIIYILILLAFVAYP